MPIITDVQLQKRNKTRANLYVDGEFFCGVEMLTVMQMGLKKGKEVSKSELAEAITESDVSVAFEKAVGYLSRAMKTERQMKTYLAGKGYSPSVVDTVIAKLKGYGYVDDRRYATLYVEQNGKTKGKIRLSHELAEKGVRRDFTESATDVDTDTERENAEALAEKYMKNKPRDVQTAAKLQRYLVGRGYTFDVVQSIVRRYKTDDGFYEDC